MKGPSEFRGDIARIYQYMDAAYPGRRIISGKNRKLFEAWAVSDSVNAWECERARRIERVQGCIPVGIQGCPELFMEEDGLWPCSSMTMVRPP